MCVPVSHRRGDRGWIYTQVFDAKPFFFCQTLSIPREIPLIKRSIFLLSFPALSTEKWTKSTRSVSSLLFSFCCYSFDRSCLTLWPHRLQHARLLFLIYCNLTFCSCYGLNYDPSDMTEFGSMTFKNIIKAQRCHKGGALMHCELFLYKKRER